MTAYAEINESGEVLQQLGFTDPEGFVGPDDPVPENTPDCTYRKLATDIVWADKPSNTSKLVWLEGDESPAWVETLTLDEVKVRKRAQITAQRLALDADHFDYMGHTIKTADKDMFDVLISDARISKGVGMPANWVGGWVAKNSVLPIATREEWDAFFIAMYDAGIANFMHSQQVKAMIDNATTIEEVEAITW